MALGAAIIGAIATGASAYAAGVTVLGLSLSASAFAIGAGSFALSMLQGALVPKPSLPSLGSFQQRATNFTRQFRQPVTAWEIVYGDMRKSGPVTFLDVTDDKKYLHMVITLASHKCEAWRTVYINDEPIYPDQLDGSGNVQSGTYAGKARIQVDLGTTTQPFPDLVSESDNWTEDHIQAGHTKVYVRLEYGRDTYPSGIPNISVRLKGKPVKDTRTDTTLWTPNTALCLRDYLVTDTASGGVGTSEDDVDDVSTNSAANICDEFVDTKTWTHTVSSVDTSENYLDLTDTVKDPDGNEIDDGLLHVWTGDRVEVSSTGTLPGGLSASTSYYVIVVHEKSNDAVNTRIKLAATYDDALAENAVSLTSEGSGTITVFKTGEPRYTCNGTVDTDNEPYQTIQDMSASFAGYLVNVGGEWKMVPGTYRSVSATFDEDKMVGSVNWQSKRRRRDRFNAVQGTHISPFTYDQLTDFPPITSSTYEAEDGGKRLFTQVDMPFVNRASTCQRIGRIILNRHRRQITGEIQTDLTGLKIKAGDIIGISRSNVGWSEKTFEVVGWDFRMEDNDGAPLSTVKLSFSEIDSDVYAWDPDADEVVPDPAPRTNLPKATDVTPPTNLVVTSGTADLFKKKDGTIVSRIRISWTPTTDAFVDHYEVQYKKSSESTWLHAIPSEDTEQFVWEVEDGIEYDVRVRTVSRLGVRSEYVYVLNHTVSGKTVPPSDVTSFSASQNGNVITFKWDQVPDVDLAGYEIRYAEKGAFEWKSSQVVSSVTKGTIVSNTAIPPGSWTVGIKAVDTSKNYSTNAKTTDIDVQTVNSEIVTYSETWPFLGVTLTDAIIQDVSKTIVPLSNSSPNSNDFNVFDSFVYDPVDMAYVEAEELDAGFDSIGLRVWGGVSASLGPGEDGLPNAFVEMRYKLDGGSYSAYQPWTVGTPPNARYFQFRFVINNEESSSYITSYSGTIDAEPRTITGGGVSVNASGTFVPFDSQFHSEPVVTVTVVDTSAKYAIISNVTTTGFFVNVFDSSGTDVGGTINWSATGV